MDGRGSDQRVGKSERPAARFDLRSPSTGEHRRLATGVDGFSRYEHALQDGFVLLSEPCPDLAHDDVRHDRLVTLLEHPMPSGSSASVASQVIDHERRV
jgi:hypothetical protein